MSYALKKEARLAVLAVELGTVGTRISVRIGRLTKCGVEITRSVGDGVFNRFHYEQSSLT